MKTVLVILMCFALCVGLTVACSFEMSPSGSSDQAGRDMTTPRDDVHENLGSNESCGTAAERSGCHSGEITISR